jgi:hypothetical protein
MAERARARGGAEASESTAAGQELAPRRSVRGWLTLLGKLALLVAITWALYRAIGLNLSELSRADLARWRPAPAPLTISAVLLIAVYLTHALLWRRIVRDLVGERLAVGPAFRIYFLANLGRYLPGRIWQVAGMAVLAQRAGVPAIGAITASALAQISFLLTGALFLAVLMPVLFGIGPALAAAGGCAALLGGLFWSAGTESGARTRRWLGKRLGPRVATALEAVGRMRARDAGVWLIGYGASWILLGGAYALFTIAFVPAAATEVRHLAGTMAAGYLSGYLAIFAPAGVGIREGVMGLLLARVVPGPAAIVISVASRIWFTATELVVLAAIPFLRRGARTGQSGEQEPAGSVGGPAAAAEMPGTKMSTSNDARQEAP